MTGARALDALLRVLETHPRLVIAVSGGVDSMTLAHVAHAHAATQATMAHACGPAVPVAARERVERHAAMHAWDLRLLDAGEIDDPRYRANPVDRCYFCKTNLYARLRDAFAGTTIASGTNVDDLGDYRPGLRAAAEHDVVHPYVEAGIDKAGVYELARSLGLGDLERLPAQPCLSSRVETGIAIARPDLAFIDDVESQLAARLGREAVVRCRVTQDGVVIELGPKDADALAAAHAIGEAACRTHGRRFAGVKPYRKGSAFLLPGAAK